MSIDVYDPCPCGSGKKLKFCCHAVATEMVKVSRLAENNQLQAALQTLDALSRKDASSPWVVTARANLLFSLERFNEATDLLAEYLKEDEDHPHALSLYAVGMLVSTGFNQARAAVHRCFRRTIRSDPPRASRVASVAGSLLVNDQNMMAARQHFALALPLAPEENQEEIFVELLRLDSDRSNPYPLRGTHAMLEYTTEDAEVQQELQKAHLMSAIGCWGAASRQFHRIVERIPDSGELWQNLALCCAWDANEEEAADAFHKAAQLLTDDNAAIACETIAQLLDLRFSDDTTDELGREYRPVGVSKLLGRLDEADRFVRVSIPQWMREQAEGQLMPTASYIVLDRPQLESLPAPDEVDLDTLPRQIASIQVYDAMEDEPAVLRLSYLDSSETDDIVEFVDGVLGDDCPFVEPHVVATTPTATLSLTPLHYLPENLPKKDAAILQRRLWDEVALADWMNRSSDYLNGGTPESAAGNPDLARSLRAAVNILDGVFDSHQHVLDRDGLLERLQLAPEEPIAADKVPQINVCTTLDLCRLPIQELDDEQLKQVLHRTLLLKTGRLLYCVLKEVLARRPEGVDFNRAYGTMADISFAHADHAETLRWTIEGQRDARESKLSFEELFRWDLRELTTRLADPQDPELPSCIKRIWDYYGPKLPGILDRLTAILEEHNVPVPSGLATVSSTPAGTTTESGLWTPGAEPDPAAGEKKLWLP